MLFAPECIGNRTLSPEELREDKKKCKKTGPCGLGEKAVYLNSFFIDRRYYVCYQDIRRIFKRVAMSKGGFTGKGVFGSIPYLVVLLSDGTEKQCNFKYEEEVDEFIRLFRKHCPSVPTMSAEAEKRFYEEKAKEEARYVKELSPEASETVRMLEKAKEFLLEKQEIPDELSAAVRQKRVVDHIRPTYRYAAMAVFVLALGALVFGVISILRHDGFSMYFVLFGMAFLFYSMSSRMLPTAKNNSRYVKERWEKALLASREFTLSGETPFPVPYQYAHPAVLDRMIRVIREGRAESKEQAYEIMKADLKALNSDVTVSQTEYDEVVAVKPLFLECGYRDELQETL